MKFWDASAVVPLCAEEPGSASVRAMLDEDASVVVWWGTRTECVSALMRRKREDGLTHREERAARHVLESLAQAWTEMQPSEAVRDIADRLLAIHPLQPSEAVRDIADRLLAIHAGCGCAAALSRDGVVPPSPGRAGPGHVRFTTAGGEPSRGLHGASGGAVTSRVPRRLLAAGTPAETIQRAARRRGGPPDRSSRWTPERLERPPTRRRPAGGDTATGLNDPGHAACARDSMPKRDATACCGRRCLRNGRHIWPVLLLQGTQRFRYRRPYRLPIHES